MTIKYLGHATFLITTEAGVRIITDPYEPGAFGGALGYGEIKDEADVITVSHEHADHNFVNGVPGHPVVLRGGGTVLGVRFEIVSAYHDTSSGKERGEDRVFKFLADGLNIVHLGDLGHKPTDAQIAQLEPIDVLMIPVGGTFTVDAKRAWEVIRALKPHIIIPMHFRTDKTKMPLAPVEEFTALAGDVPVEEAGGSTVRLGPQAIAGTQCKVIVLSPAN